jgi:hypothetical protein
MLAVKCGTTTSLHRPSGSKSTSLTFRKFLKLLGSLRFGKLEKKMLENIKFEFGLINYLHEVIEENFFT